MKKPALCVFCGSSTGLDPQYREAASRFGSLVAARGYSLVFGGGNLGLMGEAARAVRDGGGKVLGVLPAFLRHVEPPMKSGEDLLVTDSLQDRKLHMMNRSDAFVALPGGIGTYDEILDIISTKQLGALVKPLVLINTNGFFTPLIAAFDHVVREGFAQAGIYELYHVAATPEEALDHLALQLAHTAQT